MPVLGITGGIATGKSSLTRCLAPLLEAEVFDADAAARELLAGDRAVQVRLHEELGEAFFNPGGGVDRTRLREAVFRDGTLRRRLEGILHPAIRARWMAAAELARKSGKWLIVDIPLLFENRLESAFDVIVVVACRAATQRARIVSRRGLSTEMAQRMIEAQESLASKITRADHVLWSDSPQARLEEQAQLLASYLKAGSPICPKGP